MKEKRSKMLREKEPETGKAYEEEKKKRKKYKKEEITTQNAAKL